MSITFSDRTNFCGACGATIGAFRTRGYHTWGSFYRVVIVNQAENDREDENENTFSQVFQLSGIGIEPEYGGNFLDVPLEESMTVEAAHKAGYPGRKTSKVARIPRATYWSSQNCDIYPHGYPIHARCWVLLQRCVGHINQGQLECLVIALRKRWYIGFYGFEEFLPIEETGQPWIPACLFSVDKADEVTWPFQMDPVEIPEVKALVEQSIQDEDQECHDQSRIGRPGPYLATDVLYVILDLLDHADVANSIEAFNWSIPQTYWRQRLKGLVLEHEEVDVPAPKTINWKVLCLGAEQLLLLDTDTSLVGLQNRQRIWNILCGVKRIFYRDNTTESLRDFVNATYPPFSALEEWDSDAAMAECDERIDRLPLYSRICPPKYNVPAK